MDKVLIIEDHEDIRFSLSIILKKEGFNVETAENGEEAMVRISRYNFIPDFLIVDYNIPGINGIEVIKKIKEYNSNLISLLLTADESLKTNEDIKKNANYFITKPYDPVKIIQILKKGEK